MGTWGPALYSDDLASDVRDRYRELVGESGSGAEATKQLLREYPKEPEDPNSGPVFWLALADSQWRCGRLEERVKERALKVIDSGQDLERWQEEAKLQARRRGVLEKLRQRLEYPQPKKKKIPKPFFDRCDWEVGEIISYQRKSGDLVLLRVVGLYLGDGVWTQKEECSPIVEILDWQGKKVPNAAEIEQLPVRPDSAQRFKRAILFRMSERETKLRRFRRLGIKVERNGMAGKSAQIGRKLKRILGLTRRQEAPNKTCQTLYARTLDSELTEDYGL